MDKRRHGWASGASGPLSLSALGLVAAIGAQVVAAPAEAATFGIVGGSQGLLSSGAGQNDLLGSIYGSDARAGFEGAAIQLSEAATVLVTFLGFEASYNNSFSVDGDQLFSTADFSSQARSIALSEIAGPLALDAGNVPFQFGVNGTGSVVNGGGSSAAPISFFVSMDGDELARSGTSFVLFLDDAGSGPDRDFDDMAIRFEVLSSPIAPALPLFLTAVAALGLIGWQRRGAVA